MKHFFLALIFGFMLMNNIQSRVYTKRALRQEPERELFLFGDAKEKLKQQLESNQHENMLMMMKMMKRQEEVKRIMTLVNQFQTNLDNLSSAVNSEIVSFASLASAH